MLLSASSIQYVIININWVSCCIVRNMFGWGFLVLQITYVNLGREGIFPPCIFLLIRNMSVV